ncbi:MAG: AfsR family transcriptional regulator, partial [Saccharothrix sp.]|nr:AfsR family transcriptional regulator [Saccharothrix sp.]
MQLELLGTIRARSAGTQVDLGHARQRAVLAVLLLEPNEPHTADRLVERVWGDTGPRRPHTTLYGYLYRLRRALAAHHGPKIVRAEGGYRLDVDEQTVDLHRFRTLVRQAEATDDAQAHLLLDQALRLWRAGAITGVDSPWLDQIRHALDLERASAELRFNDISLRLGLHHVLLPRVSAQAARDPLDEALAAQLMLTLYRCGRRTSALDHYRLVRRALADELGLTPGPQLRGVHQQILTGRSI